MKYCTNCGSACPDDTNFCQSCGAKLLDASNQSEQNNNQNQGQNGQNQAYDNQGFNPGQFGNGQFNPTPSKVKNGLKWWQIVLIILGVIVVFAVIKSIGSDDNSNNNDGNRIESKTSAVTEATVPFTEGKFENGYYINEWADIKFPSGEDSAFPTADSESYEILRGECTAKQYIGYYSVDIYNGKSLAIEYDDISGSSAAIYTDDNMRENFISMFNSSYASASATEGSDATFSAVEKISIAGEQYSHISAVGTNEVGSTYYVNIYWRKLDNYMIVMTFSDMDDSTPAFVSSITKAE